MKVEITIEDLTSNDDYNWREVFGEGSGANTDRRVEPTPPGAAVSNNDVLRKDVIKIIAAVNGENDGADWVGLFELRDGRFLVASGGCDYTGWDCQASNNLVVAATLEDAIKFGLDDGQRARLEIPNPA